MSDRAVLHALSMDPQPVSAIAAAAGLSGSEARAALQRLTDESLAIPEDGGYELTGPLSWFGTFAAAVAHFGRRKFLVTVAAEPDSHVYLCDIRIKDGRPVGDPLNDTASVFACGKTARNVAQAAGRDGPTCLDCARAIGSPSAGPR